MSKIGVHCVIGPKRGFGDSLRKIRDAGQTLAVVKCVDDFGPAYEAKQILPNTLTVGRLNQAVGADGTTFDTQGYEPRLPDGSYVDARKIAEQFYTAVKSKWQANPFIDVWETFNEFSAHWGWQSDFYLAMMDLAEADGFKLSHYACSSGNPPHTEAAAMMLPCLKAAKQRGHYLSLHEYGGVSTDVATLKGTQPYHALRYRELYEVILIPNGADPKLIISESGQQAGFEFAGTEIFVQDMAWYDAELMKDEYVAGACAWTLGKWYNANFEAALPALTDYIVAHPNTPPRPPQVRADSLVYKPIGSSPPGAGEPPVLTTQPITVQPPGKPPTAEAKLRGAPRAQYARTYLLLPNEPATADGEARLNAWAQAVIASGVLTKHRWTLGLSADDAGVGDLDQRNVVAINPSTWPTPLDAFFAQEYPGVRYYTIQAPTPDDLKQQLMNFKL